MTNHQAVAAGLASWALWGVGAMTNWVQTQGVGTVTAVVGALGVLVTSGTVVYARLCEARRAERIKDVELEIRLRKEAAESGTSLEAIDGRCKTCPGVEQFEAILTRMRADIEHRLANPPCLAPNADGTPGCHGLGPDHSPIKQDTGKQL